MKYASAISLAIAPVAMAKAVHNAYPVRRDPSKDISKAIDKRNLGGAGLNELLLASGLSLGSRQEVIVIWVNQGGGVPTQTLNAAQTVTTTVTVAGGAGQVGVGGQQVGTAPTLAPAGGQAPPAEGGAQLPPAQGVGAAPSGVGSAPGALFTHEVTVGGPTGLSFKPQEIQAKVGDMVVFTFLSQNHTLTQSAFATPCQPLSGGMDSGYQANPNNTVNPPPRLAMQVMVQEPLCESRIGSPSRGHFSDIHRVLLQAERSLRKGNGFLDQR
jgi:plastocyanin